MGFAKAFSYAELPQLTQPISRPVGLLWLLAASLFVAAAIAVLAVPRASWWLGTVAIVASQIVIFTSFRDARFGSLANVVALAGVVLAFAMTGPTSLEAEYEKLAREPIAPRGEVLDESRIAHLPAAVRRYLSITGALGRPRPAGFRVRFTGAIRGGPADPWMPFTAEQVSRTGEAPSRYFFMKASRSGVPVHALHVLRGGTATMRVKVLGLVTVVDARGPEMDLAETVTLLNDLCIFAPGALADPSLAWVDAGAREARAAFTNAGHTVHANLHFGETGELVDFDSDDRLAAGRDGRTFTRMRWSTPLRDYRAFGPLRLASRGDAVWNAKEGPYAYGRFEMRDVIVE